MIELFQGKIQYCGKVLTGLYKLDEKEFELIAMKVRKGL